jgi:hypothetical protein
MYRNIIIAITTMQRIMICPGLNSILLLYSSKYRTRPPIPDGIETLSLDIKGNNMPIFKSLTVNSLLLSSPVLI